MRSVGSEEYTGLYLVTLNNTNPISANAGDPRMADRAVRVDARHVKVGKAANLTTRARNYHKTFGAENVNFRPLVVMGKDVLPEAERHILRELASYRLKAPSGRPTEWLVGIDADAVKERVLAVLRSHAIKHVLAANWSNGRSHGIAEPDIETLLHKGAIKVPGFKTSENSAAAETLRCMAELDNRTFRKLFPNLHHLGVSFDRHRNHCLKLVGNGGDFAEGRRGENNRNVLRRLQCIVKRAGPCKGEADRITVQLWETFVKEAVPLLRQEARSSLARAGEEGRPA